MTTNTTTKNVLRIAAVCLALLLFCGVFCGAAAAAGYDVRQSGTWDNGKVTWTYYNDGTMEITGSGVIPEWAFEKWGITKLNIGSGITSIGNDAFWGCSSLTSITLPSGLTTIGRFAFNECSSLMSIKLPESVETISYGAFWGCSRLTSIELSSSLTTIEGEAFYGCSSLTSIELPSSLTTIGEEAFYGCKNLASITIPSKVTDIGKSAFDGCEKLETVIFDSGSQLKTIGENAFWGCSGLSSITLPSGVETIGNAAFQGLSANSIIYYPSSLSLSNSYDTSKTAIAKDEGNNKYTFTSEIPTLTFSRDNAPKKDGFRWHTWYNSDGSRVPSISKNDNYATGTKSLYATRQGPATPWNSEYALPTVEGYYILNNDVWPLDSWSVPSGETILDLNGHVIDLHLSEKDVKIPVGSSLIILDSQPDINHHQTSGLIYLIDGGLLNSEKVLIDGGSLIVDGGTIVDRTISITNEGSLTLNSKGAISSYTYASCEISIGTNCVFTMDGGKLRAMPMDGYGVCIQNYGTFTMNGGTLSYYKGDKNVIFNSNTGKFTLAGGTISDNSVSGNAIIRNDGTFTMNGGNITNNEAKVSSASVMWWLDSNTIRNTGTFDMSGGTISHNTADGSGGGLYVDTTGVVDLKRDAKITDNTAKKSGGGIFINADSEGNFGRLTLSGNVVISDNKADGNGGGIYAGGVGADKSTSLTINDDVIITRNTAAKGAGVYLSSTTLRMNGGSIFENNGENLHDDNSNVKLNGGWIEGYGHFHPVCGASCTHSHEHYGVTWQPISSFEELRNIQSAGYYYLTNDITIDVWRVYNPRAEGYDYFYLWHPPNGVDLCLNGHALRYNTQFHGEQQNMIVVDKGCIFTLTDCKPDAENTIYYPSVNEDGSLNTKNVKISQRDPLGKIKFLYDYSVPEFMQKTVKGGVITGGVPTPDTLTYNVGEGYLEKGADKNPYVTAVKVEGGTFNMYSGTICGCFAKENGGGVCAVPVVEWSAKTHSDYISTVNLLGGTISDNAAKNGGGVSMEGSSYTIDGTSITKNIAKENGGGVYLSQVVVSGQDASRHWHSTSFDSHGTFKSGSITGNTAKNGGGIYAANGGHINVEGNLQIKSNSNGKNEPNNLYLQNGNALKVTGSLEGSEIGIRNPLRGQFGYGDSSYTLSTADAKSFHADIGLDTAAVRDDNTLVWKNSIIGSAVIVYNTFLYTDNPVSGVGSPFEVKAEYNKDTRTLTLTNSITLEHTLEVVASKENPLTIDLNGQTLQAKSGADFSVITVAENAGLILKDSVGGGQITGGNAMQGGGVYVSRNGEFIMESGLIIKNKAIRGAGVYLNDKAVFEMMGGVITQNTAVDNGGGVYVDDRSRFTVRGKSSVTNNIGQNSANNVYTSKPLIVFTEGLSYGAFIGITSGISPVVGHSVDVTTPTLNDNSGYFFSDNPDVYEWKNAEVQGGYVVRLIPMQHTVTYDLNGGSGNPPVDTKKYLYNAEVTVADKPADMKRDGYTFMGWNTKADGSGQDYTPGSTLYLKGDTTLYANWKEGAKYSVIVKSAGNGNAGVLYSIPHEVSAGTLIQGGVIPKSGYMFDHWEADGINPNDITSTTPSGKGTFSFSFIMPANDVTLTAYFTVKAQANEWNPNTFNVTYEANDGSGTPPVDESQYNSGDSVTVKQPGDLTKDGCTFSCWEERIVLDIDIDGDSDPDIIRQYYLPEDTFDIYHDTILYAVWKENEVKSPHDIMLLTSGHGTVSSNPAQAAAGTTVQVNVTADYGYQFVGWKDFKGITAIPGTSNPYSFAMPDSDVEVTAVFAKNQTKLPVADGAVMFDEEVTSAKAKNAGIDVEFAGVFGIPDGSADGFCISESTDSPSGADIRFVLAAMNITPYNGDSKVDEFTSPVTIAFNVILPNGYSINNLAAEHYEGNEWKTIPHWALESDGEYIIGVNAQNFSPFALVLLNEEQPEPQPEQSSSSSRDYGASVWLTATPTPTPVPAGEEPTLAQPVSSPVDQPPQQTSTPAPAAGIIAGLGAALVFGLRRK